MALVARLGAADVEGAQERDSASRDLPGWLS